MVRAGIRAKIMAQDGTRTQFTSNIGPELMLQIDTGVEAKVAAKNMARDKTVAQDGARV